MPIFESTSEKLSILSNFDNFNGVSIMISKAANISNPVYFNDLLIKDARVYLFDSLISKPWIIQFDSVKQLYIDNNLFPLDGHKYKIKVEWTKHNIESKWKSIPTIPILKLLDKSVTFDKDTFQGGYHLKYTILLADKDPSVNYFSGGISQLNSDFSRVIEFPDYVQKDEICGYRGSILPDLCLNGQNIEIKLSGSILKNIRINGKPYYLGKYYIYLYSISPSFYFYKLSFEEPDAFERYFINPSITKSDYQDALGYFAIKNISVFDSLLIK
ncbi:MAG: DUF4249 family protein [Saprospiraceae bacterium]